MICPRCKREVNQMFGNTNVPDDSWMCGPCLDSGWMKSIGIMLASLIGVLLGLGLIGLVTK